MPHLWVKAFWTNKPKSEKWRRSPTGLYAEPLPLLPVCTRFYTATKDQRDFTTVKSINWHNESVQNEKVQGLRVVKRQQPHSKDRKNERNTQLIFGEQEGCRHATIHDGNAVERVASFKFPGTFITKWW